MVFIECGLGGRVQCFVFDAVNLWWRRKCATAPDQTPQIKSKYHVVGAANTTHVNYTSAQHPDVAAMETSIANPPIMPGKLSNARHARRQLNCLQRLAPHSDSSSPPPISSSSASLLASMTYARAHDDLIWLRIRNAIRLQLLCKYFTGC